MNHAYHPYVRRCVRCGLTADEIHGAPNDTECGAELVTMSDKARCYVGPKGTLLIESRERRWVELTADEVAALKGALE